jgi:NTE family protein
MDAWREKWELALSGGGFRASFFHLGVLARLAEMGLLRRIGWQEGGS